jgi:hypothetical protein
MAKKEVETVNVDVLISRLKKLHDLDREIGGNELNPLMQSITKQLADYAKVKIKLTEKV